MPRNYESGYSKLVQKSNKNISATQKTMSSCTETYKTLNQLHPGFTSNIFKLSSSNRAVCK